MDTPGLWTAFVRVRSSSPFVRVHDGTPQNCLPPPFQIFHRTLCAHRQPSMQWTHQSARARTRTHAPTHAHTPMRACTRVGHTHTEESMHTSRKEPPPAAGKHAIGARNAMGAANSPSSVTPWGGRCAHRDAPSRMTPWTRSHSSCTTPAPFHTTHAHHITVLSCASGLAREGCVPAGRRSECGMLLPAPRSSACLGGSSSRSADREAWRELRCGSPAWSRTQRGEGKREMRERREREKRKGLLQVGLRWAR